MTRAHNAPAWGSGHRDTYPPSVRAAMALLDRVSVGEEAPDLQIDHALVLTGDIEAVRLSASESRRSSINPRS